MQRKWRRAWLRGKPHYLRQQPVRKQRTDSIKAKVCSLTAKAVKKLVPAAAAAGIFLSGLTGVQANPAAAALPDREPIVSPSTRPAINSPSTGTASISPVAKKCSSSSPVLPPSLLTGY